jgi:hypothetical protein
VAEEGARLLAFAATDARAHDVQVVPENARPSSGAGSYSAVTGKAVNVAVTPVCSVICGPLEPDWSGLSVAVTVQAVASAVPSCQTLAYRLALTTGKCRLWAIGGSSPRWLAPYS